jgi:hypothetical protein
MELGIGTAAGATDILDKEPFYRRSGIQKERVIVPWAGALELAEWGFWFRRSGT